ncbi:MAG: aminotransferase class V-fold PLP-dependent enzyme [Ignavibacteriales bacterium]|nr:aminotransferase class V-fold PLP-dependent enzyme [Ignavibacteriales bacterium]
MQKRKTTRFAPLEITSTEFKKLGHDVVGQISRHLAKIQKIKVTTAPSPRQVRKLLRSGGLPRKGMAPTKLLKETSDMLFKNSLFNGHPRFWGYISGSPSPLGILGDFLASSVNPNVGAFILSPVATEIELQTVRWIAEMIGYPTDCGGILVSGGNMANFVCFLAARKAKLAWDVRAQGFKGSQGKRFWIYTSAETHTWIQKAADLFGFGTDSIRWIPVDGDLRMDLGALRRQIMDDVASGDVPLMVIGTAGSVGTGAIDPLGEIATVCREHSLWFHVDGAYGALAAVLPDAPDDLRALSMADSVAVDPHKWLYTPLEAGCALVRKQDDLVGAFSYHPPYYKFEGKEGDEPTNFYERGLQNSRGFRALKVWLTLRQVGREGYEKMISDDIQLARILHAKVTSHPELQAFTQSLSITTFRYVPSDLNVGDQNAEKYLNALNEEILGHLQRGGEAFCSNTLIRGKFVLRACIVNFRTTTEDIEALPDIVVRIGKKIDKKLRTKESGN